MRNELRKSIGLRADMQMNLTNYANQLTDIGIVVADVDFLVVFGVVGVFVIDDDEIVDGPFETEIPRRQFQLLLLLFHCR